MAFVDILRRRSQKNQETKALQILSVYDIIKKPLLTEKTYKQTPQEGAAEKDRKFVYSFVVTSQANKNDIKVAIKKIYSVDVDAVSTMWVVQKGRSQRKTVRRPYKKAMVTLVKGQKIELV